MPLIHSNSLTDVRVSGIARTKKNCEQVVNVNPKITFLHERKVLFPNGAKVKRKVRKASKQIGIPLLMTIV